MRHICPLGNDTAYRIRAKTILVIGPPRVGKTTLIGLIAEKLAERASMAMEQDKGYIPHVAVTLQSSSQLDWKGYYRAILQALNDPFLNTRRWTTERDLREAMENALLYRKVEVVIVDEAQHLTRAAQGSRQQDQLDQLKYFENKLGVCHLLVGTYDLRPFRRVNAQLACRTIDVHFNRYDVRNEDDLIKFLSVVWAFQRQLPLPREPQLVEDYWKYLYGRSLGCVGILKEHLLAALTLALQEKADTLTLDHLERTAMPKDKLDVQLNAITLGEGDFARAEPENADAELLQSLGLDAPKEEKSKPKEKVEGQEKRSVPPSPKLRPGDRKPDRDSLGSSKVKQQRDESDLSENESAG